MAVILGVIALAALAAMLLAPPTRPRMIAIPAGVWLVGALDRSVSTGAAVAGQEITLVTTEPLRLDEKLSLPAGILIGGEIARVSAGGRAAGAPALTLRFTRMEVGGRAYPIDAESLTIGGGNDSPGTLTGGQLVLPPGQQLRIRLAQPVAVEYAGTPRSGRRN